VSRDPIPAALPVCAARLHEDRGRVTREGAIDWPGGAGTLRVDGVAPVIADATLQAEVLQGTLGVSRAMVERRWVPGDAHGPAIQALREAAAALRRTLKGLERAAGHADVRLSRASTRLERYLERVSWQVARDAAEPERWAADLEGLEAHIDAALAEAVSQREAVAQAQIELARLVGAAETAATGWTLETSIVLSVDGPAGEATLALHYMVPAAVWRPSYEARLGEDGTLVFTVMATIWQRTGEDWSDIALSLSTARPSAGAVLPPLHTDRLSLRDKTVEERRTIQAAFHDQKINKASLAAGAAGLPGVDDGGEAQALVAAERATVPSDGRPRQVVISSFSAPVQPLCVCMPAEKALVFAKVALTNAAPGPLLAGPVTLITGGGPSGTATIPFVAPGERFTLSLGSQDDVAVTFQRSASIEKRLALSDRRWLIQQATFTRTGPGPDTVEVVMRVPVSGLAQVRVVVDGEPRTTRGCSGPDAQGFVRWTLPLPLGTISSCTVAFRLERDSNVQLPDPW